MLLITTIILTYSLPIGSTEDSVDELVGTEISYYVKGSVQGVGSVELAIDIVFLDITSTNISADFRVEVLSYSGDLGSVIKKLEIGIPSTVVDKLSTEKVVEYRHSISRGTSWFLVPENIAIVFANLLVEVNNTVILAANIEGTLGVVAWDKTTRITRYAYIVEKKPGVGREIEIILKRVEPGTVGIEPPSSSEITSFKEYAENAPIVKPPTATATIPETPIVITATTIVETAPITISITPQPSTQPLTIKYPYTVTLTKTVEKTIVSTTVTTKTVTVVEGPSATEIIPVAVAVVVVILLALLLARRE